MGALYRCHYSLQWRHGERDGVSNHRRLDGLLIKEINKAPPHWHLWGESIGELWIILTKGHVTREMFPFDDVIMQTSSAYCASLSHGVFVTCRCQEINWTNDDLSPKLTFKKIWSSKVHLNMSSAERGPFYSDDTEYFWNLKSKSATWGNDTTRS